MSVVGGLDIHRKQITFDYLDVDSGQLWRGQIAPADRAHLAAWLRERFDPARHGLVELAVEACTGWRYVAEELARAGVVAHLGEPAETAALRGPSGAPRPTGLMLAICGSCWPLGGCRSVGSRRRMCWSAGRCWRPIMRCGWSTLPGSSGCRSEEHTSELQSRPHLVCRLLLEKKKPHLLTRHLNKEKITRQ